LNYNSKIQISFCKLSPLSESSDDESDRRVQETE
jgi:hypothetical protein